VLVPESALVRSEGRRFVFLSLGGGLFERRQVKAVELPDGGVFITDGVEQGDSIVVTGAQQLLSAQHLSASAGGGVD
jgi:hypothetical protein